MTEGKKVTFRIKGMHCADCALNLERIIGHLPGVLGVSVNYVTEMATITYQPGKTDVRAVKAVIRRSGYVVEEAVVEGAFIERNKELVLAGVVGLLLLFSWICSWWSGCPSLTKNLLAGLAVVIGGYVIVRKAVVTLFSLNLDVNVLVSTAIIASVCIGEYKAAATVVFIMLLGSGLENYTVGKTRSAVKGLMELAPQRARVKRNGREVEVAIEEVRKGELVIVKSGERIPMDGVVRAGQGSVNQGLVTGESVPVEKGAGEEVFGGTINEVGALEVEVTKVGEDTTIAKIVKLVKEAQENKASVQRVTDRYARYFVPLVFLVAILTFLITGELHRVITVLVVACPCALVLATPVAVVAGIGSAARQGVLIKGGVYLELTGRLTTLMIDKTGTLTAGYPQVTDVKGFGDHDEREILRMAAICEKRSEHPLANAITAEAAKLGIEVPEPDDFALVRGKGLIVRHNGRKIFMGSRELLEDNGIGVPGDVEEYVRQRELEGKTVMLFAHDGLVCGALSVADTLREGAKESISELKSPLVKRLVMLTGDNPRTAKAIARQLGIDEVEAGMLPEEKVDKVKEFKGRGELVGMVGDGINDAPALAVADVGMAMGAAGTDVAIEAADIALMTDDLSKVPLAIGLSRKTLSVIKQNLIFSLLFNIIVVTTAVEGKIGIIPGAILHQLSSLIVILNAMRLLRYRRG